MRRASAALVVFLLTVSCASTPAPPPVVRMYDGPPRTATEVAVIRSKDLKGANGQDWFGESVSVRLLAIDEAKGQGRLGYGSSWNGSFRVELLPGSHTLSVGYSDIQSSGSNVAMVGSAAPTVITFDAQAGHEYVLDATGFGAAWGMTLVDVTSGATVIPRP